jgi:hypothetical protein
VGQKLATKNCKAQLTPGLFLCFLTVFLSSLESFGLLGKGPNDQHFINAKTRSEIMEVPNVSEAHFDGHTFYEHFSAN